MASLSSLMVVLTEDAILDTMIGLLRSSGFPVVSWATKSVPRRMLRMFARAATAWVAIIPLLARSGFGKLAVGEWLSIFISNFYDLERNPPVFTIGDLLLEDVGGIGPITFAAGDLWAVADNGLRYTNITGGTLLASSTLTLSFQAEEAGEAWNVAVGEISELGTPIPGVNVSNPAIGLTGTWITQQGADEEDDVAYLQRAMDRWSTLGKGGVEGAYEYWARFAAPNVTRVKVLENTPVDGDVTLILAGPDGPATPTDVALVSAYFASIAGHVMCINVHAQAAVAHPITLAGDVAVTAAFRTTAIAGWTNAFTAYRQTLALGEDVVLDRIVQLVMDQKGALDIIGISPVSNVVIADDEVPVFTDTFNWREV